MVYEEKTKQIKKEIIIISNENCALIFIKISPILTNVNALKWDGMSNRMESLYRGYWGRSKLIALTLTIIKVYSSTCLYTILGR